MDINISMSNIVKFPSKKFKSRREIKVPNYDYVKLAEDMSFADNLTEALIVQLVHSLGDNGIQISKQTFIKDLSFIIESIKSALYSDLDIKHDMQDLIDKFMITETKNGKTNTMFNMELIPELLDITKK